MTIIEELKEALAEYEAARKRNVNSGSAVLLSESARQAIPLLLDVVRDARPALDYLLVLGQREREVDTPAARRMRKEIEALRNSLQRLQEASKNGSAT